MRISISSNEFTGNSILFFPEVDGDRFQIQNIIEQCKENSIAHEFIYSNGNLRVKFHKEYKES